MPNWVSTDMVVTGPAEDIARFKELAKSGEDVLSFDNLVPMPKELRGTSSPASIVSQEEYEAYLKRRGGTLEGAEAVIGGPITKEMSDRFIEEYGANNWYDWNNQNIGTKWGFCSTELVDESDTELKYHYDTAWGPATEGLINVSEKFPTLLFQTYMEEESNAFNGRQDFQAGDLVFEELHENILTETELEVLDEIVDLEPEEAIRRYAEYEEEWGFRPAIMAAVKARMAGEEVTVPEDEMKHLRL